VHTTEEIINTNYFGVRRVNDAFGKFLCRPGGRIVNVASASGPNFNADLPESDPLKTKLCKPWTIEGSSLAERIQKLDEIARNMQANYAYGASKALLNAYTYLHARAEPDLIINACTPGWIKTDLTARTTASNPPSKGAIPPCFLLMDDSLVNQPTGRYYGSDCVRSPLDVYRGPGDAPYVNDEDLEAYACLVEKH